MKFVSLEKLEQENIFLRRNYTLDYRASHVPAEQRLELTNSVQREEAFGRIRQELAIPLDTLHEVYASVVDGKHILLYGPPGTGKTSLAGMIAGELFNCNTRFETAVADWTPFETIGGLQLVTRDGRESLEPVPGVITEAIVDCLNRVAERAFGGDGQQGTWLVLDELNRANMDAAFGQLFTALDQEHRQVSLPFFDERRQHLTLPKRFRIIGTMNTYDRNFLFRLSYALTRRFALIPIDVPSNNDEAAREEGKEKLWQNLRNALRERGLGTFTITELRDSYNDSLMHPLYVKLVKMIRERRSAEAGGLDRGLGFAQIAAALRHAVIEVQLGLVAGDKIMEALDRGVRSSIVPQLEGLPNTVLQTFIEWWEQQEDLREMHRSIEAVRELMRGASLFVTD